MNYHALHRLRLWRIIIQLINTQNIIKSALRHIMPHDLGKSDKLFLCQQVLVLLIDYTESVLQRKNIVQVCKSVKIILQKLDDIIGKLQFFVHSVQRALSILPWKSAHSFSSP